MKKTTSFSICLLAAGLLQGCVSQRLVFQAEAVSMTRTDAGSAKKLKVEGEVQEKWCMDDDPVLKSDDDVYGLADQVIYKAQTTGKKADYITGATVHVKGNCATLTGHRAYM